MTNEFSFDSMKVSLTRVIDKWIESTFEKDEWECVGVVGSGTADIMAKAAITVLMGIVDVQQHLRAEGIIEE